MEKVPKKSTIYTKTGDNGTTSLYDGTRHAKNSIYFDCLGDIDELNSNLGLLKAYFKDLQSDLGLYNPPGAGGIFYKTEKCLDSGKYYEWFIMCDIITDIQCRLMDISSFIATPPPNNPTESLVLEWIKKIEFKEEEVVNLEKLMDKIDSYLPKITNFVVPSGDILVSQTHICRAISRRCERNFLNLTNNSSSLFKSLLTKELNNSLINNQKDIIKKYLNRLSDLLFILSRFIGLSLNITEDLYSKKKGLISTIN